MNTSILLHKSLPWLWAGAQLGVTLPGCEDEPCPGPVFTSSWDAAPWPQSVTLNDTHDTSPHRWAFILQAQNELETMIPANKPSSHLKPIKIPSSSGLLFIAILTQGLL